MKRINYLIIITCIVMLSLIGRTVKTKVTATENTKIELKDDIDKIFAENNLELKIKQANGNYYRATPEFTTWLSRGLMKILL